MERGRLHKARRGELFHHVPLGYVKLSPDRVDLDPDEQVRDVIRLVFDKYDEIGSVWGVFHYLVRNNIRLGIRPFQGLYNRSTQSGGGEELPPVRPRCRFRPAGLPQMRGPPNGGPARRHPISEKGSAPRDLRRMAYSSKHGTSLSLGLLKAS